MPARKNEELIASWRPGEARNWSPMVTAMKTRAGRPWRLRGRRRRSPVATAREMTSVARGDRERDDAGRPWRPRGRRRRSPVATARMACSVARVDREGGESAVALWHTD
ncbi:hypothetical protein Bca101_091408 [Brassica carinata]